MTAVLKLKSEISLETEISLGTVPPESINPLGRGKTLSLPKCFATNSPWWVKFLNLVLDGRDQTPRQTRRGILQ